MNLFRARGSTFLIVAAVADCAEIYLDRQVADRFRLQFKVKSVTLPEATARWRTVLNPSLSLAPQTLGQTLEKEGSLRRSEAMNDALGNFRALFGATTAANESLYAGFRAHVELA